MIKWESKASIDNPKWKYTNSVSTDVAKTIARVKREMAAIDKTNQQQAKRGKK